jgi:hypothetical protein
VKIRGENIIGECFDIYGFYGPDLFGYAGWSWMLWDTDRKENAMVVREAGNDTLDGTDTVRWGARYEKVKGVTMFMGRKVNVLSEIKGIQKWKKFGASGMRWVVKVKVKIPSEENLRWTRDGIFKERGKFSFKQSKRWWWRAIDGKEEVRWTA